jgi:hypothetical protein
MEKFMYPSLYMNITQGYGTGTHKGSYAIDDGGSDGGKDYAIAPYSGTVKRIYPQYENEVFFVSDEKVQFANGLVDYATTMFVHEDSPMAYGMAVGKHYKQGEKIYVEGGRYKGQNGYFANHFHFEFARGTDADWYKNSAGIYSLKNAMKPQDCCFISNKYHIINTNGYNFVNIDNFIKYQAHVAGIGWQDWKYSGETAGTTGKGKSIEAIRIDTKEEVYAKAHIQGIGWKDFGKITKDTIIGTTGQSKRLEALQLKGNFQYRVHIAKVGWSTWTKADGIITLGSVGEGLGIEAIQIKK